MTRAQAQVELLNGKKISHRYFADNEYVYIRDSDKKMIDEVGNVLNKREFWLYRNGRPFDIDWFVIEENKNILKIKK